MNAAEKMKRITWSLNAKSEKTTFAVSVAIALIFASVLLVSFYVWLLPVNEGFTTIYLLDTKKGVDYPEFLVANVNSTVNVYVDVENHLGRVLYDSQVLVKIVSNSNPTFPVEVNATEIFTGTIQDGSIWETMATITLNEPNDYLVVFELWIPNLETGTPEFSGQFCTLSIQVAPETAITQMKKTM